MRAQALLALALLTVSLSGCAVAAHEEPEASPSATPTVSAERAAQLTKIIESCGDFFSGDPNSLDALGTMIDADINGLYNAVVQEDHDTACEIVQLSVQNFE